MPAPRPRLALAAASAAPVVAAALLLAAGFVDPVAGDATLAAFGPAAPALRPQPFEEFPIDAGPRAQNEPSAAADPFDPEHVVVAAMSRERTGDSRVTVYESFDGGEGWDATELFVPAIFAVSGDPAVAFGRPGEVYVSGIAFTRGVDGQPDRGALLVWSTTDHGTTWTSHVVALTPQGTVFHDKPWIAADSRSEGNGRVFLAWALVERLQATYTSQILIASSDDNGATWTMPAALSGPAALTNLNPHVIVAGSRVVVAWHDWYAQALAVRVSSDGGASWSASTIAPVVPVPYPFPGGDFRVYTAPFLAAAADGSIYATWADYTGGQLVAWASRSLDGLAWAPRARVDDTGLSYVHQAMPTIEADENGFVHVVWYDNRFREDEGTYDLFATTVAQPSLAFPEGQPVTGVAADPAVLPGFMGDYIGIAAAGRGAMAAWTDTRNGGAGSGNQDVYGAWIA